MNAHDRDGCLPGTRQSEIKDVYRWLLESGSESQVLCLRGPAGFGKSTLATSLATDLSKLRRQGAFLFFSRDVEARSTPSTVIRTLAYQLALFDNRIAAPVMDTIDRIPNITERVASEQFSELIVEPLRLAAQELSPEGPIVIILDALDEAEYPSPQNDLPEE